MDDTANAQRTMVRQERLGRGLSARDAAAAGHISNTTWSQYEAGTTALSSKIIAAVALAFDWSPNWTTVTPPDDLMKIAELRRRVLELTDQMERMQRQVEALAAGQASRR